MNKKTIPTKDLEVTAIFKSGIKMNGCINIIGFDRLSDFLNNDKDQYIKLYKATVKGVGGVTVVIPKSSIDYYIPKDE